MGDGVGYGKGERKEEREGKKRCKEIGKEGKERRSIGRGGLDLELECGGLGLGLDWGLEMM